MGKWGGGGNPHGVCSVAPVYGEACVPFNFFFCEAACGKTRCREKGGGDSLKTKSAAENPDRLAQEERRSCGEGVDRGWHRTVGLSVCLHQQLPFVWDKGKNVPHPLGCDPATVEVDAWMNYFGAAKRPDVIA